MIMDLTVSDIVAISALALSAYATIQTVRFNKRQKSFIELQEKLNSLLLEKESNEAASGKRADIGASILPIGSRQKRVKIWNKGKATAKNIRISFPEGNDSFVHPHDVEEKFPLEALETFASVELLVVADMTTKPKQVVQLHWDDDFALNQEKLVYLTL